MCGCKKDWVVEDIVFQLEKNWEKQGGIGNLT